MFLPASSLIVVTSRLRGARLKPPCQGGDMVEVTVTSCQPLTKCWSGSSGRIYQPLKKSPTASTALLATSTAASATPEATSPTTFTAPFPRSTKDDPAFSKKPPTSP